METLEEWNARADVAGARLADPDMGAEHRRIAPYPACPGVELVTLEGIVQPFPLHFHGFWTVGQIVRGRRRTVCRGEERVLGPGDLVLFGPGEVHGCQPVGEEPLFYRSVVVPDELFEVPRGARFSRAFVRDPELAEAVARVYALASDESAEALERQEALAALVGRAAAHCDAPAGEDDAPLGEAVERARALLDESLVTGVSLDELAQAAGLSRYHFLRVFSARAGLTPHRYLQAARANRARSLLAAGATPAEAAAGAGFSDQAHMTRVFKALFGLTPARYRAAADRAAGRGR
ncbi:AraC family transcriptional regulator [Arabiibacter massiliensis]|uniref:AraC family transcriptional regulator n=1 Tax=Arabiibacter massiliensis TaxID=1870985 RepID=UPI0009BC5D42|nr:AraC family transcriptional regulator [Arabiibacter massiliensis]